MTVVVVLLAIWLHLWWLALAYVVFWGFMLTVGNRRARRSSSIGEGFGTTWMTNWRRAAEVPVRTLGFTFVATSVSTGLIEYYLGSQIVSLAIVVGLACGTGVSVLGWRKMRPYRSNEGPSARR